MGRRSLILLVLFLLELITLPVLAAGTEEEKELGFWIEAQAVSKQPARAILWYEKDVTEQFGFFAFVWKESDGYREYLAGPTWKPFEGLQLGAGIGREAMPKEGRGSRRLFFFNATKGDLNLYGAFEDGRTSGPWYKVTATYAVTEKLGIGIMKETDLGLGPRVQYSIGKNVQVWGAALRGNIPNADEIPERKTTMLFGINYSF